MGESRHVALLRGINVGGKHLLPMKQLVALFEEAGAGSVRTYIQSGNVIFAASASTARSFAEQVESEIFSQCGFRAPIVTRSATELRRVVRDNPFLANGVDVARLSVAFLKQRPTAAAARALDPDRSPPDRLALSGRDVYLDLPNGAAKTRITNAYLDATLSTTSTVRNWKTVLKLVELTAAG